MTVYYVAEDGAQKGPFSLEQVKAQCSRGEIQAQTLMWRDGLSEWQAAAIVLQGAGVVFSNHAQPPRPPPSSGDENPYDTPSESGLRFEVPAASLSAGRGTYWVSEGWNLFKAAPGMWIAALLIWIAVQFALGFIPFIGTLAGFLLGPSFAVGLLAFAHGIATDGKADLAQLFAGFKDKLSALVVLGLLYMLMVLAVAIVGGILAFILIGGALSSHTASAEQFAAALFAHGGLSFLLLVAVFFALIVPVMMAYLYAPALVFFANQPAGEALKQSFNACMRNWLPLTVFGLVSIALTIVGAIPFGLGLLVVVPMLFAANYAGFRDTFGVEK